MNANVEGGNEVFGTHNGHKRGPAISCTVIAILRVCMRDSIFVNVSGFLIEYGLDAYASMFSAIARNKLDAVKHFR